MSVTAPCNGCAIPVTVSVSPGSGAVLSLAKTEINADVLSSATLGVSVVAIGLLLTRNTVSDAVALMAGRATSATVTVLVETVFNVTLNVFTPLSPARNCVSAGNPAATSDEVK